MTMTTVQMIIDRLTEPAALELTGTVDRLIAGNADTEVRVVAVAFQSSYEVIRTAVGLNAELLITHEPTYYLHHDETDWLQGDDVYEAKRRLIEESGIAIYRLHDYIHRYEPDGILQGLLERMGWMERAREGHPYIVELERTTVANIAKELKARLPVRQILLFGDPSLPVSTVAISPGMSGGRKQIELFSRFRPQLLIAGETHEWETDEYARDAAAIGGGMALLVIGHEASEEPGMRALAGKLNAWFPSLSVSYVPSSHRGPIGI